MTLALITDLDPPGTNTEDTDRSLEAFYHVLTSAPVP